jgi:excisionase family DNA binding protein
MEKQFLSREEAASLSGLSISTIDNLIKSNELPACRPTGKKRGRVLIRLSDFNSFLESRSTHAQLTTPPPEPTANA